MLYMKNLAVMLNFNFSQVTEKNVGVTKLTKTLDKSKPTCLAKKPDPCGSVSTDLVQQQTRVLLLSLSKMWEGLQ